MQICAECDKDSCKETIQPVTLDQGNAELTSSKDSMMREELEAPAERQISKLKNGPPEEQPGALTRSADVLDEDDEEEDANNEIDDEQEPADDNKAKRPKVIRLFRRRNQSSSGGARIYSSRKSIDIGSTTTTSTRTTTLTTTSKSTTASTSTSDTTATTQSSTTSPTESTQPSTTTTEPTERPKIFRFKSSLSSPLRSRRRIAEPRSAGATIALHKRQNDKMLLEGSLEALPRSGSTRFDEGKKVNTFINDVLAL